MKKSTTRNRILIAVFLAGLLSAAAAAIGVPRIPAQSLDTSPPVISNIEVSNITENSATLRWTTDEPTGTTPKFGLSTTNYTAKSNSEYGTTHTYVFTGLTPATSYHYRIYAQDDAGNAAESADYSFTTTGTPEAAPPVTQSEQAATSSSAPSSVSSSGSASILSIPSPSPEGVTGVTPAATLRAPGSSAPPSIPVTDVNLMPMTASASTLVHPFPNAQEKVQPEPTREKCGKETIDELRLLRSKFRSWQSKFVYTEKAIVALEESIERKLIVLDAARSSAVVKRLTVSIDRKQEQLDRHEEKKGKIEDVIDQIVQTMVEREAACVE